LIGRPNEISVRVLNKNQDASNVRVTIGIYYFSASDPDKPQFYDIALLERDFPVGLTDISHIWTPSSTLNIFSDPDAHICIRVSIEYGLDSDFSNHSNVAQRNLKRLQISSPAVFKFRVENPLPKPAKIHLDVQAEKDNPPGWTAKLSDNDFEMDPFACARNVEIIVTPPEKASTNMQATYHVYATGIIDEEESIALGGLSVQAFVAKKPGLPFAIIIIIILALILIVYFIIKRIL